MLDPNALIDPLTPKPTPRKTLGQPITWNDATLAEMSAVRTADIAHAAALWHNEVSGPLKTLLEAQPESHDVSS